MPGTRRPGRAAPDDSPRSFARVPPGAIRDVIERGLLGRRPRPALGQVRSDLAVGHRPLRLALGAVVRDAKDDGRAVDTVGVFVGKEGSAGLCQTLRFLAPLRPTGNLGKGFLWPICLRA